MAYLADTNIFLEILLSEARERLCESFLSDHRGNVFISDFSINSIGVILFRLGKIDAFQIFLRDLLPKVHIARLPEFAYQEVIHLIKNKELDFDDAYQLAAAKEYDLTIVTIDRDFKKLQGEYSIILLGLDPL